MWNIRKWLKDLFKRPGSDWRKVTFVVLDVASGIPLSNVLITIENPGQPDLYQGTTDLNGIFYIPNFHKRVIFASVTATTPGYHCNHAEIYTKSGESFTIYLVKKEVAPPALNLPKPYTHGRNLIPQIIEISSFRLLKHFMEDRTAYVQVVEQIKHLGFNSVRVFTNVRLMFYLNAGHSVNALPDFLTDLSKRGLYCSIVAIADSAIEEFDWRLHARNVAHICAQHNNAIFELFNEPNHHTQLEQFHDPKFVEEFFWEIALATNAFGTAGPAHVDEDLIPTGHFVSRHLDRSRDEPNMVRRVRELEWVSGELQKPVWNKEPIGFGEVAREGARIIDPQVAFTFGALARIMNVTSTFHCEDGLHSRLLGPNQYECAKAFIEGHHTYPESKRLTFKNATWHDSPVKSFNTNECVRAYSGINGSDGILLLIGVKGNPAVEFQHNWTISGVIYDGPAYKCYRIRQ